MIMEFNMNGELKKPLRCHGCGALYDFAAPEIWFPSATVHQMTHQLPICTRAYCCGVESHTELVATVSAYLRDVKGNAKLVCNLVNQRNLQGRPEPKWLTEAWATWEQAFKRPEHQVKQPEEFSAKAIK